MPDLAATVRNAWSRANHWSPVHTVAFAWAMYLGVYVVLWARFPGAADELAITLLMAFILTGWAARWAAGVTIVALASLMWWAMGFQGVRLEAGSAAHADAFATFIVGTFLLGVGRVARMGYDASRQAATRRAELAAAEARAAFQTRFLSMAAHEISTPLTPIKLQLASLKPKAGDMATGLERIERNVARLERLTKDLSDASRLQEGTMRLLHGDVDLAALVRDVLHDAAEAMDEKQLTCDADIPEALPLQADGQRLEQVAWNLLRNAIRYTPAGGAIRVRAWQDGAIHLEVQDSGLGMTAEQIARAGSPFTQFHRDQVREGTGLGLFITKGIIAAHGGALHIESNGAAQGSTFRITLPAPKA